MNEPKTLEEAKKKRYGQWIGNPYGRVFVEGRCAAEVWPTGEWIDIQCRNRAAYGPDGLYCKVHAKKYFPEMMEEVK